MTIREFYNSLIWQKQRKYKMQQENYRCARCDELAEDVHHKITLTEQNVNSFDISLDLNNLESLCRKCHNKETHSNKGDYCFDKNGDLYENKKTYSHIRR